MNNALSLHTAPTSSEVPSLTVDDLLKVSVVYYEPDVLRTTRGLELLKRYESARKMPVDSHWQIPQLHGNEGSAEDWIHLKRTVLVLGLKKSISSRPNCRSSHFIAPSHANGCTMACTYCYVPRRKGYANPITLFTNIDKITAHLRRHAEKRGPKPFDAADQIDPSLWVYDIGEQSDCSVDAALSDNVRDLVTLFRELPNAKASFATKFVNRELLDYDPQGHTRVRFSLMPQQISRVVDVRTSRISDRIRAINDFVDAGYEVHINLSPVIYTEGWLEQYAELFEELDDTLTPQAKEQLAAEIICLTHNEKLHDVNMRWHPKAEDLLWKPELQQVKYSQTGMRNLRYKNNVKRPMVEAITGLVAERLPYCRVRYAF
ncbi:MAG: spore photoproduct lyase family protein [Myxococcales bacterium]